MAAGAEAFKKDIKDAQINLLNGGHFVLEEKHAEAASIIKSFLFKNGIRYNREETVTSNAFANLLMRRIYYAGLLIKAIFKHEICKRKERFAFKS